MSTKNNTVADATVYLPLDIKNAQRFLELVHPTCVFIKYEYWLNYLNRLNKQSTTYLISGYLRTTMFFRWYGGFTEKH
jgi:3-deoxy-D-manno-octulosonic-acid transferase